MGVHRRIILKSVVGKHCVGGSVWNELEYLRTEPQMELALEG